MPHFGPQLENRDSAVIQGHLLKQRALLLLRGVLEGNPSILSLRIVLGPSLHQVLCFY